MTLPTPLRPTVLSRTPEGVKALLLNARGNIVSEALTTKHYSEVKVHVYAVPPDSSQRGDQITEAVVELQQSIDGNGWKTMQRIENPNEGGEIYVLDPLMLTRAIISGYSEENYQSLGINVVLEEA